VQPSEPKPQCVQSFTYVFGLERRPHGERHAIERPARYEFFRASQPYSLTIEVHGGEIYGEESGWLSYKVFETMPGMSHWLVGEPGWEAVAKSALSWLEETVSLAA